MHSKRRWILLQVFRSECIIIDCYHFFNAPTFETGNLVFWKLLCGCICMSFLIVNQIINSFILNVHILYMCVYHLTSLNYFTNFCCNLNSIQCEIYKSVVALFLFNSTLLVVLLHILTYFCLFRTFVVKCVKYMWTVGNTAVSMVQRVCLILRQDIDAYVQLDGKEINVKMVTSISHIIKLCILQFI